MQALDYLKAMKEERFLHIYETLSQDGHGPLDGEVAKALKFRPHMIRKVPFDKRARTAKAVLARGGNGELCYELFASYLLKDSKQLVIDFLDKTDVPHEEGMVQDIQADTPAPEKISAAVKELDETYSTEDVTLYLALAAGQWPNVPEVASAYAMR